MSVQESAAETIKKPLANAAHAAETELKPADHEEEQQTLQSIYDNSKLTFSFLVLLIGSTVVTTLGLLLNEAPIVIGGMIISPLMWPLLKIALSMSYGYKRNMLAAMFIAVGSILTIILTAAAITYVSPLKSLNAEIIARTSPTFFHIVIGLAAGAVATLAITHKRISESLAGVAIAASLLPPLATSGIGLSLGDMSTFYKAFLLFASNALSIILIATIFFSIIGFSRKTGKGIRNKSLLITSIALVLIALPLITFLRQQSFALVAYSQVRTELTRELKQISPDISIESVRTNLSETNPDTLEVETVVWLPENVTLSYSQQQNLTDVLEKTVDKRVNLRLRLQREISLLSDQNKAYSQLKEQLENQLVEQLISDYPEMAIDSLSINRRDSIWTIDLVLRGNPDLAPTLDYRAELEKILSASTGTTINLNIELIPRIQLKSEAEMQQATDSAQLLPE